VRPQVHVSRSRSQKIQPGNTPPSLDGLVDSKYPSISSQGSTSVVSRQKSLFIPTHTSKNSISQNYNFGIGSGLINPVLKIDILGKKDKRTAFGSFDDNQGIDEMELDEDAKIDDEDAKIDDEDVKIDDEENHDSEMNDNMVCFFLIFIFN
jgi:hypothetical protein